MRRDWIFALLLCVGAALYFAAPPRATAVTEALLWWTRFGREANANLVPGLRGLNVAVFDGEGRPVASRAFDTYWMADSGFPEFIGDLPADRWVVVAVQDDAATNLSPADLEALESLGGTRALEGQITWSYVLVGRPGLEAGAGMEWLDTGPLDITLPEGGDVAGQPLPVTLRIYSAGFSAGSYASVSTGETGWENLRRWIWIALTRA